MAWFCSWRTLCTTGCLMAALLLGGSARGISFSAIEVPQAPHQSTPFYASPLDVSPDGSRIGGLVVARNIIYDCPSYLGCTNAFTWDLPTGATFSGQSFLADRAEQVVQVEGVHTLINLTSGPALFSSSTASSTSIPKGQQQLVIAKAMSSDAATVVGSLDDFQTGERYPFYWSENEGVQRIELPMGDRAGATTVSADGNVISGPGFRWTKSDGTSSIPEFIPEATSDDGAILVGYEGDIFHSLPVRWDTTSGLSSLPVLAGSRGGAAFDLSSQVGVAVGQIYFDGASYSPLDGLSAGLLNPASDLIWLNPSQMSLTHTAVLWDAAGNVHNLQTWLTTNHNFGPQLTGWSLISANAISADGRVIAGVGINPEGHFQGWVVDLGPAVVVPEPAASVMLLASISLIIAGWTLTRRLG